MSSCITIEDNLPKRVIVFVNPTSGGGAALKVLPQLRKEFQSHYPDMHEIIVTSRHGEATEKTRSFMKLDTPPAVIVGVGGDGTIHEIVNGIFHSPTSSSPPATGCTKSPLSVKLAVLSCGTGGDFVKSVPSARTVSELMDMIQDNQSVSVDISSVCFPHHPEKNTWFINVVSFGVSYDTIRFCDSIKSSMFRFLGGKFAYMCASAAALLRMRLRNIRIMYDNDGEWHTYDVCCIAIANGKYFGGGMSVSPTADPTDMILNVTIWREGFCGFLCGLSSVYNGNHVRWGSTVQHAARVIHIETNNDASTSGIRVDCDGELTATLPMIVSVSQKLGMLTWAQTKRSVDV